jgi:hypothetical protein
VSPADTLTATTVRRWRIWFFVGQSLMLCGVILGPSLFRDDDAAWIACVVVAAVGVAVMVVAGIRWRRAEKQEAADRAAAPSVPPDPRHWRVIEMRNDDD